VVHPAPLYPKYPAIGNPLAVPAIPRGLLEVTNRPLASWYSPPWSWGAASLVGRFRRARGTERLQLRWLAWGRCWRRRRRRRRRCWSPLASLLIEEDFTVLDLSAGSP
jgi:hypothetical protein